MYRVGFCTIRPNFYHYIIKSSFDPISFLKYILNYCITNKSLNQVSCQLQQNKEEKVILYDCRSLKEFKHRHIKNSIWFKNLQENITYINVTQLTKIVFVGPSEIVAKTVDLSIKGFNFEKNVCFGMIDSV